MQAQALVCFLNLDILIMEVGGGLFHFQIETKLFNSYSALLNNKKHYVVTASYCSQGFTCITSSASHPFL